jgi:tetratricopeptide (TPR) repeat protein
MCSRRCQARGHACLLPVSKHSLHPATESIGKLKSRPTFDRRGSALECRFCGADPFFPGLNLHVGRLFFFLRDYDRATNEFARTLDLHPAYAAAHEYLGDACEKKGLTSEAVTQWTAALNLSGEAEQANILEQTFTTAGFEAAVRALAQKQLERLQEKTARGDYVPAWHYLMAYARLADNEQAFAWLVKAAEERNWFAFQIKVNPILDPLGRDPRFSEILDTVRLKN